MIVFVVLDSSIKVPIPINQVDIFGCFFFSNRFEIEHRSPQSVEYSLTVNIPFMETIDQFCL